MDQPAEIHSRRTLFHSPDFLKLWVGQTISVLGSHITGGGLPLLAVITLGATPFQMGLLQAIGSAPVLLFSLAAGVWVDRLRRRPVMIATDLGRALVLFTIPLAAVLGYLHIWQIYVVLALTGILNVLFNTAYRAYLPSLVEQENIVEGNSRLALSESAAEIIGPGLTGLLVQTITAPIAILFDALSFLISVLSLGLIRKPEPPPAARQERQSMLQEAREGVDTVLHNPILRALAAAGATSTFFGSFIGVLYALYAIRILHITPAAMGLTIGIGGASSLVGALLATRTVRRFGLGRTLLGVLWIEMFFTMLIPLAASFPSQGLALLIASQAGDILGTIYFINAMSLRQSITPGRLLGRVNASMELLVAGIGPLGALVGGFLGSVLGVQTTLFIAVLGLLSSSVWIALSPIRKLDKMPDSIDHV
jgi:MFS family permease